MTIHNGQVAHAPKLASVLLLVPSLMSLWPMMSTADERTIVCESHRGTYQYCRVDTEGKARLKNQLSRAPCQLDSTWGYDHRGVWVDDGCRGEFTVGKQRRHDNNDNSDIATAIGVIGGIALLGALLDDSDSSSPPPSYQTRVPAWAIGSFRGYDEFYSADIEFTITPEGRLSGYANNSRIDGYYHNNQLQIGRGLFHVRSDRNGFVATEVGNSRNQIYYRRIR